MDVDVTTKQKISNQLGLRQVLSMLSLITGVAVLGMVAVIIASPSTSSPLPALKPLKAGTYVPAQVVFKVKAGKSPIFAARHLLASRQTMYRNTDTGQVVPSSDPAVLAAPASFTKTALALHQKSLQSVFPKSKLTDSIRTKILGRTGAVDPSTTYANLGLDRWYVMTVAESSADVAQMVQRLAADTNDVEVAGPNSQASLNVTQQVSGEPGTTIDETVTTTATNCTNPNDPYSCTTGDYDTTLGDNSHTSDQWGLDAINVRAAWNLTKGQPSTIIAVPDTGVDFSHPEFQNRIWLNTPEDINHNGCADYWSVHDQSPHVDCHGNTVLIGGDIDTIDNDGNGYVDDINGMNFFTDPNGLRVNNQTQGPSDTVHHGSFVASVIAANTDTQQPFGMASVCPKCTIMPLLITDNDDLSNFATDGARAIQYAVDNGADIINMSWGTSSDTNYLVDAAVSYAAWADVTLVAGSGNTNISLDTTTIQPQTNPKVIVVGANQPDGRRWYYTNLFGGYAGSNYGTNLSLMAPGVAILGVGARSFSTVTPYDQRPLLYDVRACITEGYFHTTCGAMHNIDSSGYNQYLYYGEGTSFASPFVSGVVGLMKSINPALSPYDIQGILDQTATSIHSPIDEHGVTQTFSSAWNPYTGYGLVNAQAAVKQAYDRRPDFGLTITPGTTPIIAVDTNKVRFDLWVENRGWTTASHVPYQIINADTNAAVYSGFLPTLYGNVGGWLYDTVTVSSVPTHAKVVIDPDNQYSEPFENDNSSSVLNIAAYGTPYINHQERQQVELGASITIQVTANDVNTPVDQLTYSASNLPTNATFTNRTFSWTPDASLSSGTYYPVFTVSDPSGLQSATAVPVQFNNQSAVSLSNVTVSMITFEWAKARWTSNVQSDAKIEYGPTMLYGQTLTDVYQTTEHDYSFRVDPGTTYHYRITSCTVGANRTCVSTSDQIYQAPPIPVPVISNVDLNVRQDMWPYNAKVTWDSGVPTAGWTTWVKKGTPDVVLLGGALDNNGYVSHHSTAADPLKLDPNSEYTVLITACTNQPAPYLRCVTSSLFPFSTHQATSPPVPVVSFNQDQNTATISWNCPEMPTNGTVQVFLDSDGSLMASIDYPYVNNHQVNFSVLPGAKYRYHIRGTNSNYWCADMIGLSFTAPPHNSLPIMPTLTAQTAYRSTVFTYQFPAATDPEGKALSYSVSDLPPGATFDPVTRKISWLLATNKTYLSSYAVLYYATDPDGGSASTMLKISVQTLSSFLAGTPITMANGSTVPIEQLNIGDRVQSYNPATSQWGIGTVEHIYTHPAEAYYTLNDQLRVTAKHPIWTQRGWVTVADLQIGEGLLTRLGSIPLVSKILTHDNVTVYNLEVSGDHTYTAGGFVVHNKRNPYVAQ